MTEAIEAIELSEFVKKTISDIESSVSRKLFDPIEIEISITKSQKLGGNLKLFVGSAGGEGGKEAIAKIRFEVPPHLKEITGLTDYANYVEYHRLQSRSK